MEPKASPVPLIERKNIQWLLDSKSPRIKLEALKPKVVYTVNPVWFSSVVLDEKEQPKMCVCNFCRQVFSATPTAKPYLRQHIFRRHPTLLFDSFDNFLPKWKSHLEKGKAGPKRKYRKQDAEVKEAAPVEPPMDVAYRQLVEALVAATSAEPPKDQPIPVQIKVKKSRKHNLKVKIPVNADPRIQLNTDPAPMNIAPMDTEAKPQPTAQ